MPTAAIMRNGRVATPLTASINLAGVTVQAGDLVSWKEIYYSAGPGFDWLSRVIRYGTAVAHVKCTHGCSINVDTIDVRIEGRPEDVCHLIDEVIRWIGGEVIQLSPVVSAWRRGLDRCQVWITKIWHAIRF